MFIKEYLDSIKDIMERIYEEELDKLQQAGKMVAEAMHQDRLIHVFGCGHSHMIAEELFYRAGGMVMVDPIFEESAMLHGGAYKSSQIERMSGYAALVLERYSIQEGDIFLISSSSGINPFPIEMAEIARKRGAKVIGITSGNYRTKPSRDKRGVHLADVCDLCIDNYVPHGDAIIPIEEDGTKAGPVSSIIAFYIAHSITLSACEYLQERGDKPLIFKSGNVEGGDEYNEELIKKYMYRVRHL